MSGKNITTSLIPYLLKYKQLPYVAIKKNSRWYLIPHKPLRPKLLHFDMATNIIKQHSLKYNQFFLSDKLSQKAMQKFRQKISHYEQTKETLHDEQLLQKWKEYYKNCKQYQQKYKQPFRMMSISNYCLFKKEYHAKLRQQKQKIQIPQPEKQNQKLSKEANNTKSTNQSKGNAKKEKYTKENKIYSTQPQSLVALRKINSLKVNQVWNNMSPEQKMVYDQKYEQFRAQNETRIKEFIRNHEVPKVRFFSKIGRFLSKYAVIYQMRISDPQIYKKYKQLPEEEKKEFGEQAKQMNKESKQRMEQFLRRWNISKQQLKYIIEVSETFHKVRKSLSKGKRNSGYKANKEKLMGEEYEDGEDDYDMEDEYFQDVELQRVTKDKGNEK